MVAGAATSGTRRDRPPVPFETFKRSSSGTEGMVATDQPVGSAAGAQMPAMGGDTRPGSGWGSLAG